MLINCRPTDYVPREKKKSIEQAAGKCESTFVYAERRRYGRYMMYV
jgi:hypothetical protein